MKNNFLGLLGLMILISLFGCDPDSDKDGFPASEDCDDTDAAIGIGVGVQYFDGDGDGFGLLDASVEDCVLLNEYAVRAGDCDDANANVHPDALELCDRVDTNCDGEVPLDEIDGDGDSFVSCCRDAADEAYPGVSYCFEPWAQRSRIEADHESVTLVNGGGDCDDTNADMNRGRLAIDNDCDNVDNDCSGIPDDDIDHDGDGFVSVNACDPGVDCDDTESLVYPGASETLFPSALTYLELRGPGAIYCWDSDGDGFQGDYLGLCLEVSPFDICADQPIVDDPDCNDESTIFYPGADEICDGRDNDCDGEVDENSIDAPEWFADTDGDGFGDLNNSVFLCEVPEGYLDDTQDCDDSLAEVNPNAVEICEDSVDNDCNGVVDVDAVDVEWFADVDGDGFGDASVSAMDCTQPADFVLDSTDCNDESDIAFPDNPTGEVCDDSIDNDCDGTSNSCALSGFGAVDSFSTSNVLGDNNDDRLGSSVALGDVNGDQIDDFVVGIPNDDSFGSNSGKVVIFFGDTSGTLSTTQADSIITSEVAGSKAGTELLVCDLNSDGQPDLAIGAPGANTNTGMVFVLYGPIAGVISLETADVKLFGETSGDNAGRTLACGDLEGTGGQNLVVGAYGSNSLTGTAYVLPGSMTGEIDLATTGNKLFGETPGDFASLSLAVGDLNNDLIDDLVVGAYGNNSGTGVVYVLIGPISGNINLEDADYILIGEILGDNAGASVCISEDLTGAGVPTLAIGAPGYSGLGVEIGQVYLLSYTDIASGAGLVTAIKITGVGTESRIGTALEVGDLDGDGQNDLVVGANLDDGNGNNSGSFFVFHGLITVDTIISSADAAYYGESSGDQFASKLSVGDHNNDDKADIASGSPQNDDGAPSAGATYIILGTGMQ